MLSSLSDDMPQPVSATMISMATLSELRRPSGSSKALHSTVIVPSRVYLTGTRGREKTEGKEWE